ncbi:MAG: G1 family glutamic endopeptidase [Terracidiphilus sp.]
MRSLVVDDEVDSRARLIRMLGSHPEIVVIGEAQDGLEAVEKIEALEPDLLFLDIEMPGLTGLDVLRSIGPNVPLPLVIFITGYDQHALAAFDANALAYLLKPVEPDRLATAVERALRLGAVSSEKERERGEREIPPGFVLTPGGYRHSSLVHPVSEGHRVRRRNDQIQVVHRRSQRIVSRSAQAAEDEPVPGLGSGWITFAWWLNDSGSSISQLSTQWVVPQPPTVDAGQTVFLFNALEDAANNDLVQPVLQWGVSRAGGGSYWAISNWYNDRTGHVYFSNLVPVNPGDQLTGMISMTDQSNGGFGYVCSFAGFPQINLQINGISELAWASQTLEAYQIESRSDYPNSSVTSMSSIFIAAGGANPPVNWQIKNVMSICGEHSTVVNRANPGGQVDISYGD